MFIPNNSCVILPFTGNDMHSQPQFGDPVTEKCTVIKINFKSGRTPLRGSVSGSRGDAQEIESNSKFLFTPQSIVQLDDMVQIASGQFRVMAIEPQYNARGLLDHNVVSCSFWGYV